MTLPNLLSGLRMILIVPFVYVMAQRNFGVALIIIVVAGISDLLDGILARKLNSKSSLGAILDPMADKLLIFASFLTLFFIKAIPFWLFLIVMLRDIQVAMGYYHLASMQAVDKNQLPLGVGKLATALQIFVSVAVVVKLHFELPYDLTALFLLCAVVTVAASVGYFIRWFNVVRLRKTKN